MGVRSVSRRWTQQLLIEDGDHVLQFLDPLLVFFVRLLDLVALLPFPVATATRAFRIADPQHLFLLFGCQVDPSDGGSWVNHNEL